MNKNEQVKSQKNTYFLKKQIAKGACGTVYLSEDANGRKYIIKQVVGAVMGMKNIVEREAAILYKIKGICKEYLVCIEDYFEAPPMFWGQKSIYIVLEYVKNAVDLGEMLQRQDNISLLTLYDISLKLLEGLYLLHTHGIVHRDIKPENIIYSDSSVRYIDYGFSCSTDPKNAEEVKCMRNITGTPDFLAPEIAKYSNEKIINKMPIKKLVEMNLKIDVYALGCVFFEMFLDFEQEPIRSRSGKSLHGEYESGEYEYESPISGESKGSRHADISRHDYIIKKLENIKETSDAKYDVFMTDVIEKMTEKDWKKRADVKSILEYMKDNRERYIRLLPKEERQNDVINTSKNGMARAVSKSPSISCERKR